MFTNPNYNVSAYTCKYMLYEYICSHFKNRAFIAYVAFLSLNFYHLKMKGQLMLLEYKTIIQI